MRGAGSALEGDDVTLTLILKTKLKETSSPIGRNIMSKGLEIERPEQIGRTENDPLRLVQSEQMVGRRG